MPPARGRGQVFTIAPGVPFLPAFTRALLNGHVVADFPPAGDPLALADATIYVPTRRAARALAREILCVLPGEAAVLPRIVPLGHPEMIETGLLLGESGGADLTGDLPPAVGEIERRMALTRLILEWGRRLQRAIVSIDPAGNPVVDASEALLVATSPPQAWRLAGELAGLIDEMFIEGVSWDALRVIVPDSFDQYWRITLEFLAIASTAWPAWLAGRGLMDAAERQVRLLEAEVARLDGRDGDGPPVIAIGSTGTSRATAHLLAAISRTPRGAVVLPGLDQDLDAPGWTGIGAGDATAAASPGHPQAALFRLLTILGVAREDVHPLGTSTEPGRLRARFLSEALRPADTTEQWSDLAGVLPQAALATALQDVRLVEAPDQREEALALAVAAREALEQDGRTVALVTPDRELARRVQAELVRWNVEVDDSGGDPLGVTPAGALARHTIACAQPNCSDAALVALLSHPLACFGLAREDAGRLAGLLESAVLRQAVPGPRDLEARVVAAEALAADRHAHRAVRTVTVSDWMALRGFVRAVEDALAPLRQLDGPVPLANWIAAHRATLVNVIGGAGPDGRDGAAFETLDLLLEQLADAAGLLPEAIDAGVYAAFFDQLAREAVVRGPGRSHPRFKILGLLEARLLNADLVLLGGLDEGVWPPQAHADPFLNRPMRALLGLSPPERRTGQTAHDFVQASGNPEVVVSRALKRDGAPTVPSRFLQRMQAVAGEPVWQECLARGRRLLDLVAALDHAGKPQPVGPPEPRPPVALRPVSLSVTRVETLRRDPYSIYAERILGLAPLNALDAGWGARETGTYIHQVIADFVRRHPVGPLPSGLTAAFLVEMARDAFQDLLADPSFRTFRWPRIEAALVAYLDWEAERRDRLARVLVEQSGAIDLALPDGSTFRLTAQADRIEIRHDGTVELFDFKTGQPPTAKQIDAGFAPQLTLEAAMLRRGGFRTVGGVKAIRAFYVRLLGQERMMPSEVGGSADGLARLGEDHLAGLVDLLDEFRSLERSWPARPYVKYIPRFSSYDHLARVREWSDSAGNGASA